MFLNALLIFLLISQADCKHKHHRGINDDNDKRMTHLRSKIGINYGRIADNLPSPAQVRELLRNSTMIRKVKLFDAEPSVLAAFANTDVTVVVAANNGLLSELASDWSKAFRWVNSSVAAFYPSTNITHICVGNEVSAQGDTGLSNSLLPAMKNVHSALLKLNLHGRIKVSTPVAMSALKSSYPPSRGTFDSPGTIGPILSFLNSTGNPFMVNVYPFFAYSVNSNSIPLDYVLFRSNAGNVDPMTGLNYTSMFDAQLDAVHFAMQALGFDRVPVVVSETGWPSDGEQSEIGASISNAKEYVNNLVKHVSRSGTPARPDSPSEVYIFALFNEDDKPGPTSERNYGLFQPNGTPVYSLHTARAGRGKSGGKRKTKFGSVKSNLSETWCLAKPSADVGMLEKGIAFVCNENAVDCSAIQNNGSCFEPENVFSHASFVYNSYYQKMGRHSWNCYFQDTAVITISDPSSGSCRYISPKP